jgi:poly-gamma-glutamate synthesis protein (capsule biosynthesis protein)
MLLAGLLIIGSGLMIWGGLYGHMRSIVRHIGNLADEAAFQPIEFTPLPAFNPITAEPAPTSPAPNGGQTGVGGTASPAVTSRPTATPAPTPNPYTAITISAAGDTTLGGDPRWSGYHRFMEMFERSGRDYSYFLQNVSHIFAAGDLTILNLEGTLTDASEHLDKPFAFRGPPDFARILSAGNVDIVSLANNHAIDYFDAGYKDTVEALRAEGIGYFGNDTNTLIEVNGIKVGLFGLRIWGDNWTNRNLITAAVNDLRGRGAQLVIAYYHWGVENANMPEEYQRSIGRFSIDAGADLVLGAHPHVLQGIEVYRGRNIVYSLANFCFGGHANPSDQDSFIFQQTFTFYNGVLMPTNDTNIIPVLISSARSYNNFQPTVAAGADAERILRRINEYSQNIYAPLVSELDTYLNEIMHGQVDRISLLYKNIETGFVYTYNPNRVYASASLNKISHALYMYGLADEGLIYMDAVHFYTEADRRGGTGRIQHMDLDETEHGWIEFTTRELLFHSIRHSCNVAFHMLSRYAADATAGTTHTYTAFARDIGARADFVNWTGTFSRLADVYEMLAWMEAVDEYIWGEGLYADVFRQDVLAAPGFMAANHPMARKYGWADGTFHEAAVVYAGSPYILVILSDFHDGAAELFRDISRNIQRLNNGWFS